MTQPSAPSSPPPSLAPPQPATHTAGGIRRAVAGPLVLAGVGVAAFAFVGTVTPGGSNPLAAVYLPCPSLTVFGVLCPLCGGTRAARALVRGEPTSVVGLNALLPVLLLLGLWSLAASLSAALGRLRVPPVPRSGWFWGTFGALVVIYGIVRNLPWEPFTWLAP